MAIRHPDKNKLLEYFYLESSEFELNETLKHVQDCPLCMEYLDKLEQMTCQLSKLPDRVPIKIDLDLITGGSDIRTEVTVWRRQIDSVLPYLRITLSMVIILVILYFLHNWITLLPFWGILEDIWVIQKIGSFGLSAFILFLFGSFVTMALATALLLNSGKLRENC